MTTFLAENPVEGAVLLDDILLLLCYSVFVRLPERQQDKMDRRPFLRNRELSELSPLTQSTPGPSHAAVAPGLTRNHSYGSILPYLGFLRNSLRRSASSSNQVHTHTVLQVFSRRRNARWHANLAHPIFICLHLSARACANNHLPGAAAPTHMGLAHAVCLEFQCVFACCPHMGTQHPNATRS